MNQGKNNLSKDTLGVSADPAPGMNSNQKRGYTLLEVLLYAGVLALFLVLVTQVFISVKLANARSVALVSMSRNLRQATTTLSKTIKNADNIVSPVPGDSNAALVLDDGAVSLRVNEGILTKTENGETWAVTTDEVSVIDLLFVNAVEATQEGSLKISLIVESNYLLEGGMKLSEELETCVSLR